MPWNFAKFNDQSYFFQCDVDDKKEIVYSFSDLKFVWQERETTEKILDRAKQLNKRIEYDDDTILKTLATSPSQLEFTPNENQETVLKLKYYISQRPFTFRWYLDACSQDEFFDFFTKPLLLSVNHLLRSNDDLKAIIKKKDIEIDQYKIEGAVLKRSKVQTDKFDEQEFEEKYRKDRFGDFLKYVRESYANEEDPLEETAFNDQLSPRKRANSTVRNSKYQKRFIAEQQRITVKIGDLNYDSDSDSCNTPSPTDGNIIKTKEDDYQTLDQTTKIESSRLANISPRKTHKKFNI